MPGGLEGMKFKKNIGKLKPEGLAKAVVVGMWMLWKYARIIFKMHNGHKKIKLLLR